MRRSAWSSPAPFRSSSSRRLFPWMMEKFGKKVYTIAADYNFGQISAEWVRNIVKETWRYHGRRGIHPARRLAILADDPEHPESQARLRGYAYSSVPPRPPITSRLPPPSLHVPMGSSVNVGQAYEHKRFEPPSLANMYVTTNWIEEVDTPRRVRISSPSGTPSSRTSLMSIRRPRIPISPSISISRWSSERSRPRSAMTFANHRARAMSASMRRKARSASIRRASIIPHDLSRQGRGGSFDQLPEGVGRHQAILAWSSWLRPDEDDPKAQYTPSNPPPKT